VSLPSSPLPIAIAPGGIPGRVSPPSIRPLNESTLFVSFEASAEANGATVEEYVIETSSQSSFTVKSQIRVQPNHQTQRITTRAHSLPWEGGSTFTLSLGDYHGDFTVAVGDGETTVRVQNGNSVLERSSGTASLSASVAKGVVAWNLEFALQTITHTMIDICPYAQRTMSWLRLISTRH